MGGLGALYAAARRPEATLSLTLLEPGAFALGQSDLRPRLELLGRHGVPDGSFVRDPLAEIDSCIDASWIAVQSL
jgi:hypothetical protein